VNLVNLITHPSVLGFVWIAIVITAVVAFVDAMMRPMAAWIYAGENRTLWLPVTFAACALPFALGAFMWLSLGAAMYYLVDKKPKLAAYQPPRRRENNLHDNWR
jgi:hypothetical protein